VGFRRAGKDAREWAEKRQKALERAVELKEERLLLGKRKFFVRVKTKKILFK
jgi:hypothetical protein